MNEYINISFSFSWDWKSQPEWIGIFKAIDELFSRGHSAYHYEIETGSDEYGLLISGYSGFSQKEAVELWMQLQHER